MFSSPAFVRRLATGATCILAGVILLAIWIGSQLLPGTGLGGPIGARLAVGLVCVAGSALSLCGWWLVSSPDPALIGRDAVTGARRLLRISLIIALAAFLAGVFAQVRIQANLASGTGLTRGVARQVMSWSMLVYFLNWMVKTFTSLQYTRTLAARIPSVTIAARAKRLIQSAAIGAVTVLGVIFLTFVLQVAGIRFGELSCLVFIPLCGGFVSVLVWWAVYVGVIVSLRSELASIVRYQRAAASQTSPATRG